VKSHYNVTYGSAGHKGVAVDRYDYISEVVALTTK
jgi:hypothetical protein